MPLRMIGERGRAGWWEAKGDGWEGRMNKVGKEGNLKWVIKVVSSLQRRSVRSSMWDAPQFGLEIRRKTQRV